MREVSDAGACRFTVKVIIGVFFLGWNMHTVFSSVGPDMTNWLDPAPCEIGAVFSDIVAKVAFCFLALVLRVQVRWWVVFGQGPFCLLSVELPGESSTSRRHADKKMIRGHCCCVASMPLVMSVHNSHPVSPFEHAGPTPHISRADM